jgi:hypothetical protein
MREDTNRLYPLSTLNCYSLSAYADANAVLRYANVVNNRICFPYIYIIKFTKMMSF